MARYNTEHSYVDVGIPIFFPDIVKKTVIRDTKTGKTGKGLDRDTYGESDRKAWQDLQKKS